MWPPKFLHFSATAPPLNGGALPANSPGAESLACWAMSAVGTGGHRDGIIARIGYCLILMVLHYWKVYGGTSRTYGMRGKRRIEGDGRTGHLNGVNPRWGVWNAAAESAIPNCIVPGPTSGPLLTCMHSCETCMPYVYIFLNILSLSVVCMF